MSKPHARCVLPTLSSWSPVHPRPERRFRSAIPGKNKTGSVSHFRLAKPAENHLRWAMEAALLANKQHTTADSNAAEA